ncbi:MAG TPA: BTAD domain-containing putative transcriptional regulator [Pseudonocardiaceae bacterium]|nr:BTAD domain-containing putative transcriptional regulator [Pseudonocardiaceae bacterium]
MAADPIEFRLFGGIQAYRAGQPVDIGHARQQCVLAVLLVEANTAVSADELIDRVWAGNPPHRAKENLYSYLTRLRRALPEISISRHGNAYVLSVEPSAVDLHEFRRLVRQARGSDDRTADGLLGTALARWRGEPFAGQDNPWLNSIRATIDKEHNAAELDHIDLQLRLGRHNKILPTLNTLAETRPLDERIAGQLMLTLYRAGRQADALNHYQQTRTHLNNELGIDPNPALRDLHQQILTTDPTLAVVAEPAVTSPVPRQLPAAPRSFTGRAHELDSITAVMDARAAPASTVIISAIGGTGGIGKTWLALHWAHQNLDRFPDGQLFVNLHGFDPSGKPTTSSDAIRGFLDALGVDPSTVPTSLDAQTALYRSLVADKRILVVLDNAADPAQVVPLLPGSPSCTVLVTSRDRLVSLVTAHGARPLSLDALTQDEARALLANRLGADRLAREPAAVDDLLTSCAGLPLALSIVAGRALEHPDFPLGELAEELRDAASRLSTFDEDPAAGVRSALSWSYAALSPEQARIFGLLGIAPGPDISLAAAANLTGLDDNQVRAELRGLERISLVQQQVPGRYRMHDLVRLYAVEQITVHHPQDLREAALRRLIDFYLHTAFGGQRVFDPRRPVAIEPDPPVPGCRPIRFEDEAAALAWCDAEHACLVACGRALLDHGWYPAVYQLAWTLDNFNSWRGHIQDNLALWQAALVALPHLSDPTIEARIERRLGHTFGQANRYPEAIEHVRRALTLAERAENLIGQAQADNELGYLYEMQGDYRTAREYAAKAFGLFDALGDRVLATRVQSSMGWLSALLGEYEQAEAACKASLEIEIQHQDEHGQADDLDSLGYIAHHTGRHSEALEYYGQSLSLYRKMGNSRSECDTLDRLAQVHATLGDRAQALSTWRQALALLRNRPASSDAARIQQHIDDWTSRER